MNQSREMDLKAGLAAFAFRPAEFQASGLAVVRATGGSEVVLAFDPVEVLAFGPGVLAFGPEGQAFALGFQTFAPEVEEMASGVLQYLAMVCAARPNAFRSALILASDQAEIQAFGQGVVQVVLVGPDLVLGLGLSPDSSIQVQAMARVEIPVIDTGLIQGVDQGQD